MQTDEGLLDLVENEIRRRLSEEPCSECGRGAEAHHIAPTALSQLVIGLSRLEIAKARDAESEREESVVSPYALLETAAKLPAGHVTRDAILERVEGEAQALLGAVGKLKAE